MGAQQRCHAQRLGPGRNHNDNHLRRPVCALALASPPPPPLLLTAACIPQDLAVSPLGTVVVGPGEAIQIRSAEVLTGIGELGIPRQRAVAMALADYGPIKGHAVSMGAGLDSLCSA